MLDWLWQMLVRPGGGPARPVPPISNVRVTFDEAGIALERSGAAPNVIAWAEIATVGLVTGDAFKEPPELSWLLQGRDRRRALLVPMGATGEHELVHEMQARLVGFDNMAVVEAMSATGAAGFLVWDADWPRPPTGV